jgi:hypothetical protein
MGRDPRPRPRGARHPHPPRLTPTDKEHHADHHPHRRHEGLPREHAVPGRGPRPRTRSDLRPGRAQRQRQVGAVHDHPRLPPARRGGRRHRSGAPLTRAHLPRPLRRDRRRARLPRPPDGPAEPHRARRDPEPHHRGRGTGRHERDGAGSRFPHPRPQLLARDEAEAVADAGAHGAARGAAARRAVQRARRGERRASHRGAAPPAGDRHDDPLHQPRARAHRRAQRRGAGDRGRPEARIRRRAPCPPARGSRGPTGRRSRAA